MVKLYNRKVRITLEQPGTTGGTITITDLDVSFSVKKEKNVRKDPNSADITIYNLSDSTRKILSEDGKLGATTKGIRITLEAGYEDSLAVVFIGDIIAATSSTDGVDWVTQIEALDSINRIRKARSVKSYKAGVKKSFVIKDLIKDMALDPGNSFSVADSIKGAYANGKVVKGKSLVELNKILDDYGLIVSFQNQRVQIIPKDGAVIGQTPIVSPSSGLIGSPEFGAPEKKGGKPIITVKSLLRPEITPGQSILLSAKLIAPEENPAKLIVKSVEHVGSTEGEDWFTIFECNEPPVKTRTDPGTTDSVTKPVDFFGGGGFSGSGAGASF